MRRRALLRLLVQRVVVGRDGLRIEVRPASLQRLLDPTAAAPSIDQAGPDTAGPVVLSVAACLKRAGMATKLLIEGEAGGTRNAPDRSLLRVPAQAHRSTRVLRLAFLAPEVVAAILQGRQPPEVTAKRLSLDARLPLGWADQAAAVGLRSPSIACHPRPA